MRELIDSREAFDWTEEMAYRADMDEIGEPVLIDAELEQAHIDYVNRLLDEASYLVLV